MKYALMALFVLVAPFTTSAQKHCLYADAGLSLAYFNPGYSATYNYNILKHLGIGAGTQGYVFHPAVTNPGLFTPAIFVDVRFRIRPERTSQYLVLVDLGEDFYKHNDNYSREGNYVYTVPNNNGVYYGLGIGYFRHLSSRGGGLYATFKLINNIYKSDQLDLNTGVHTSQTASGGTLIVSLGFRFGGDSKKPAHDKNGRGGIRPPKRASNG